MKITSIFLVSLTLLLLFADVYTLKVERESKPDIKKPNEEKPITQVANSTEKNQCSQQLCMSKYGLIPDPFASHCEENATCWKLWLGLPDCKDDDTKCWKQAVGYPKNCSDDDYDCWIKYYGYASCQDAKCLKQYLNYSCAYDDLTCWKTKTWTPNCAWNDWDCLIKESFMQSLCNDKKGYECVSQFYGGNCKIDDEKCWRQIMYLPNATCQKDLKCFKQFYFLPTCKDDDYECWKKLYWGPECKKGDMECLKKFLYIPECKKQKDQIQCYKKWLGYPDCKSEDGKCWKDYDAKGGSMNTIYFGLRFSHEKTGQNHNSDTHNMSFGKIMEHKRKMFGQQHKLNRQFHMKKSGFPI